MNPDPRCAKVLEQLVRIETEMRRIGFWQDEPPDLLREVELGTIRSASDAPSFELWLQCIFLPNARQAAETDSLPSSSQVGLMALNEYVTHSVVEKAHPLYELLEEFDFVVTGTR